jgi:hypothetical protein
MLNNLGENAPLFGSGQSASALPTLFSFLELPIRYSKIVAIFSVSQPPLGRIQCNSTFGCSEA